MSVCFSGMGRVERAMGTEVKLNQRVGQATQPGQLQSPHWQTAGNSHLTGFLGEWRELMSGKLPSTERMRNGFFHMKMITKQNKKNHSHIVTWWTNFYWWARKTRQGASDLTMRSSWWGENETLWSREIVSITLAFIMLKIGKHPPII